MNSKINNIQGRPNQSNLNQTSKVPVNENSGYTEDWIKIKSISNGMIVLPNNEKVTGVKVYPKNIFILDPISQESVLNALRSFYDLLKFEFWLIAADRPVDISVYISQLQIMLQNATNPTQIKIISQDLEKANMFINNQVVDTEYYILFKDRNPDEISKKIRLLIQGFANCSLIASQTSNEDLRTILDNFLNGGVKTEFGTVVLER